MPRIVNERLAKLKPGKFDIMSAAEFYEKFRAITAQPHLQNPLRYYFLLLFWTGRRPVEILDRRREHYRETKKNEIRYLCIESDTKKGGEPVDIYLRFDQIPQLEECWRWISSAPMDFQPFKILSSESVNLVTYTVHRPEYHFVDGKVVQEKIAETRKKEYPFLVSRLRFWSNKFFGVPLYFFRHNRFSDMVMNQDADYKDIKIFKGARSDKSVSCYIRPTTGKMINLADKVKP